MNHKQYKFTVPDIAKAAEVPEARVRYAIRTGSLVPTSLKSIIEYVTKSFPDKHGNN